MMVGLPAHFLIGDEFHCRTNVNELVFLGGEGNIEPLLPRKRLVHQKLWAPEDKNEILRPKKIRKAYDF